MSAIFGVASEVFTLLFRAKKHVIDFTLLDLQKALSDPNQRARFNADGKCWYQEGRIQRLINLLLFRKDAGKINLAIVLCKRMDKLERNVPCSFAKDNRKLIDQAFFRDWVETAKAAVKSLETVRSQSAVRAKMLLERRISALESRMIHTPTGHVIDQNAFDQMKTIATEWKAKQKQMTRPEYTPAQNAELLKLNENDLRVLTVLCTDYQAYAKLLIEEYQLRKNKKTAGAAPLLIDQFFSWTIRGGLSVEIISEFAGLPGWLHENKAFTRADNHTMGLDFTDTGNEFKKTVLRLKEGQPYDVLNKHNLVRFRGDYSVTVKELFEYHYNFKNIREGNFEWRPEHGDHNFHNVKFGYWNALKKDYEIIDFTKDDWFQHVRPTAFATYDQLKLRYPKLFEAAPGVKPFEKGTPIMAARATTKHINPADRRRADHSHAFVEYACYNAQDGRYEIREFGWFGDPFPEDGLEFLAFFANTVRATFKVDYNGIYLYRQQAYYPSPLTNEMPQPGQEAPEGSNLRAIRVLAQKIKQAMAGKIAFQLQTFGCPYHAQDVMSSIFGPSYPDLFTVPRTAAAAPGPLGAILRGIKIMPKFTHDRLMRAIMILFAPWRGGYTELNGKQVWISCWCSDAWAKGTIHQPAELHIKLQQGFGLYYPRFFLMV